eukprot:CAMPEP_0113521488 /NCGR_PEP_ID=MMETSP0014_2-20120614/44667_1 /TAXON_ID=2857 /ORGANISM="Nitzschia sp." /LENGTH=317 /DNA_ID=CAMNT_0000419451 /DNA_START=321 /DNA_END=1274 /DNA_ORIENTATION=+ /assembly_acc=CAM_ASM_000159
MRVIQDEITEMMLAATPNATSVATGPGPGPGVAATTRKQSEPEMDSSSLSSSSSSSSSTVSSSSSGSERSTNSSLAALAEKEPSLRPSILKQLLQNLSFAHSGLDGDMFSAVVSEEDTEDEEEEEERQDSTTTVSPPSPPPVPVPVSSSSSSTNNHQHQHQHQQKTTPVKKSQPRRSPGYSRRTPSPHFLSRKQMSPDGVVTIPTTGIKGERKPLPPPSRHVRFNTPSNVVVFVPTRAEFDPSTKRAMWTDAKELQDQIFRNKMEYQAEGGDPTQVLEDDDMYRDVLTGELIHPYWIEQATAPEDITPIAIDDIDAW